MRKYQVYDDDLRQVQNTLKVIAIDSKSRIKNISSNFGYSSKYIDMSIKYNTIIILEGIKIMVSLK